MLTFFISLIAFSAPELSIATTSKLTFAISFSPKPSNPLLNTKKSPTFASIPNASILSCVNWTTPFIPSVIPAFTLVNTELFETNERLNPSFESTSVISNISNNSASLIT